MQLASWRKRRACDVQGAKEGLENELWRRWTDGKVVECLELILQPFRHFTYVTVHSPALPFLYLSHSSFSNPSFASPTSQAHVHHLSRCPWLNLFRRFWFWYWVTTFKRGHLLQTEYCSICPLYWYNVTVLWQVIVFPRNYTVYCKYTTAKMRHLQGHIHCIENCSER